MVVSLAAATATVEVSREVRVVARGSAPLPASDDAGKIIDWSPIPLQELPPGTYDAKVTVAKETSRPSRRRP